MKRKWRNVFLSVLFVCCSGSMLACSGIAVSTEPCICGATPTKGYQNSSTGKMEYYCKKCSSECEFCSETATEYYTSGLGIIIFACEECYQDITGD